MDNLRQRFLGSSVAECSDMEIVYMLRAGGPIDNLCKHWLDVVLAFK